MNLLNRAYFGILEIDVTTQVIRL